jgi:hypothetical protein
LGLLPYDLSSDNQPSKRQIVCFLDTAIEADGGICRQWNSQGKAGFQQKWALLHICPVRRRSDGSLHGLISLNRAMPMEQLGLIVVLLFHEQMAIQELNRFKICRRMRAVDARLSLSILRYNTTTRLPLAVNSAPPCLAPPRETRISGSLKHRSIVLMRVQARI